MRKLRFILLKESWVLLSGKEVKNNLQAQLVALELNERCDFGDTFAAFQYLKELL